VGKRLRAADKKGIFDLVVDKLELGAVLDREIKVLSGGEL